MGIDSMPSLQGIIRHLETTYFTTAAIPEDELAACLPFSPALFQLRCCTWREGRLSSLGCAGWPGGLYTAPALLHTAESGRAVFSHSPCAARPSGSIRVVVEVLSVCDGSAPFQQGGSAEPEQTIYQERHKERHQPQAPHSTAAVPRWDFPVPPQGKTAAVPRGKRENISQGTLWVQCDRAVCAIRTGTGAAIHGQADPALVFPPGTSEPPAKPTAGSAAVRAQ